MNAVRHGLALILLLGMPPALGLWFAIHPFARTWRRIGPAATYAVLLVPVAVLIWCSYTMRATLLGTDLGTRPLLVVLGAVIFSIAIGIARMRGRHLTRRILVGVPELSSTDSGHLLTDGIYARVRNPRYIEVFLIELAYACVANFSGTWLLILLSAPVLHLIVLLEEAELRDRFGAAYIDYCRRVPRWIPRR